MCVCMCVCVCMYVCMYVCIYVCIYICMYNMYVCTNMMGAIDPCDSRWVVWVASSIDALEVNIYIRIIK